MNRRGLPRIVANVFFGKFGSICTKGAKSIGCDEKSIGRLRFVATVKLSGIFGLQHFDLLLCRNGSSLLARHMTLPSIQQDSWREKANRQGQKRFARGLRRVVIVLAVAVLAGILLRLLFPPFFAPTTHLVLLGTGINEAQQLPPIPFVAEDYQQLAEIDSIAVHDQSQVWQTARRASRLEQELQRTGVGQSDTLLLYLTAHGVSQDGTAYLLCDNFDLRRPDSGRVSVDAVLEQISRSPAALKVLVINPGMLDYDPRLGMLFNEFPHLLEEAVKKTQDASCGFIARTPHSSKRTFRAPRNDRYSACFLQKG
jgi:hypothetical protein